MEIAKILQCHFILIFLVEDVWNFYSIFHIGWKLSSSVINSLRPRETHICVGNLTIISSDNGLSPGRHQAIILTNAGILLIGPLGTNFSGILIEIQTFPFKEMRLKLSSAKWRPFCLSLNVLMNQHCKWWWHEVNLLHKLLWPLQVTLANFKGGGH